ncbi:hypothetical protein SEA_IDYN_86 [Gordonia phage IDyn]|uniref:Uncharacterized protein n=1 Tax=Gordonia phage IDyn TaxID=2510506 RepID=A0A411CU78_9CAUD|nr:hypothetical protein KNU47_gp86 [Gordonia phage IDyn]QAY17434.1 hypothetical protein SEA_IDYN_86 [Gordonia phage IDyn]
MTNPDHTTIATTVTAEHRAAHNRLMINDVQVAHGLAVGARGVAGPAVVDARDAHRAGWLIIELTAYGLFAIDADGDSIRADYSPQSNGVTYAAVTIGGRYRQITPRNTITVREQVQNFLRG